MNYTCGVIERRRWTYANKAAIRTKESVKLFIRGETKKNKGKLKNFTRDIVTDSFRQRLMASKQTVPSV